MLSTRHSFTYDESAGLKVLRRNTVQLNLFQAADFRKYEENYQGYNDKAVKSSRRHNNPKWMHQSVRTHQVES